MSTVNLLPHCDSLLSFALRPHVPVWIQWWSKPGHCVWREKQLPSFIVVSSTSKIKSWFTIYKHQFLILTILTFLDDLLIHLFVFLRKILIICKYFYTYLLIQYYRIAHNKHFSRECTIFCLFQTLGCHNISTINNMCYSTCSNREATRSTSNRY